MSIKLKIKGSKDEPTELPRGASNYAEGDVVYLTPKGGKETLCIVDLVEHFIDLNNRVPIPNTIVTLEKVKPVKKIKPVEPTISATGV